MGVDVVSSGELYTALSAGFPAEKIYFHGNCKTDADHDAGRSAWHRLLHCGQPGGAAGVWSALPAEAGITQKILLRVTPGIDPHTYEAVSTGKVDSKFGAAVETGQAMELVKLALAQPHLSLPGTALPRRLSGVRRGRVSADGGYHGAVSGGDPG